MTKNYALITALSLAVSACSTVPAAQGEAKRVPAERVYAASYLAPSADRSATILVARDKGFLGSGCSHDIVLNNEKVVSLRQGEAATIHVAPGDYFLKLETGGGLCGGFSMFNNITIKTGETQAYRVLVPADGRPTLTRDK